MCFSVLWLVQTLTHLIILCLIVGVLRILVPYILAWLGIDGTVIMRVITLVIWAIVCIWVLWFLYDLYTCSGGLGYGGYRRIQ